METARDQSGPARKTNQHRSSSAGDQLNATDEERDVALLLSFALSQQPQSGLSLATSSSGNFHPNPDHYTVPPTSHPLGTDTAPMPHALAPTTNIMKRLHNDLRLSSPRSNDSRHRPTYTYTFLPTPPPEPNSSLPQVPQCPLPETYLCDFERSREYPYGVQTPGVVYPPGEDYFGR